MAPFPPPPTSAIDWETLGFQVREVNGHVESRYSVSTGQWSAPTFVRDPHLRIHGMAPALNYGQQAFEGLKVFRQPGDAAIAVFRPDRNAARLQHSAAMLAMPPPPEALFVDMVRGAVARNAEFVPPHATGAAMYVRPLMLGTSAQLGLNPPDEYLLAVYVMPTGVYHGTRPARALVLDGFDRAAPNGTGSAKVGGNYAPVMRWSEAARKQGFGITLHLDSAAHDEVDEFSTSGFLGVLVGAEAAGENAGAERVTLVVPSGKAILNSVTSDSAQRIARAWGWKVEKRPIKYHELPCFSEVMAAGTAVSLVPIRSITRRVAATAQSLARVPADARGGWRADVSFADDGEAETVAFMADAQDEAGPRCARLLAQLKGIQLGKTDDAFGWRVEVSEEDGRKMADEAVAS